MKRCQTTLPFSSVKSQIIVNACFGLGKAAVIRRAKKWNWSTPSELTLSMQLSARVVTKITISASSLSYESIVWTSHVWGNSDESRRSFVPRQKHSKTMSASVSVRETQVLYIITYRMEGTMGTPEIGSRKVDTVRSGRSFLNYSLKCIVAWCCRKKMGSS